MASATSKAAQLLRTLKHTECLRALRHLSAMHAVSTGRMGRYASIARVAHPSHRLFSTAGDQAAGSGSAVQGRKRDIVTYPNEILRQKCVPAPSVHDADVQQLAADLLTTVLEDGRGIGLAAPQIAGKYRMFAMRKPKYRNEYEFKAAQNRLKKQGPRAVQAEQQTPSEDFHVVINPVIVSQSPAVEIGLESCLSVPEYPALVRRSARIEVKYMLPDGTAVHEQLHGAPAIVFQHEYDHLEGILLMDREVTITKRPLEEEMEIAQEKWHLDLMKYYGGSDLD